ncbi:unnamed protein product [Microthlaspi erraticum]|uniref:Uncharacterized protein n=1 Tax=Microthlaspi erraticum TaxID=1685480 RepID=A0A6D2J9U7_9BRAS|nr:unnamed protein product [Microthlaspi erraticum]
MARESGAEFLIMEGSRIGVRVRSGLLCVSLARISRCGLMPKDNYTYITRKPSFAKSQPNYSGLRLFCLLFTGFYSELPKLDERLHPGTTVHRGTRFILPSIGLTGAPCQCLVGSHIVIWYHTRPRQLTRLSSESSSLHAQPPRCQSGWALTCENALDYTFLNNMWLDTPHVLST